MIEDNLTGSMKVQNKANSAAGDDHL